MNARQSHDTVAEQYEKTSLGRPVDSPSVEERPGTVSNTLEYVGGMSPAGAQLRDSGDRVTHFAAGVGTAVGRAAAYLTNRHPAEMRARVESAMSSRPLAVLAGALAAGFVVGRKLRR